ncbi:MAG: putative UDP-N-acetylmuramoylalanine--D-glutamate ligase [Candidatus Saccharibacteria bacterium]|nr:putative UDP-N-acetylmuramoylalanine--D-glutamate ligase [Candidatus Saccharibacteria bacterium]
MKIAIAGYGVEGQASYAYYSKDPNNEITIADQNPDFVGPKGIPTIVGPDAFEKLADFDLVLRSPPVAPRNLTTNGKVWSVTNEFFAQSPAPIIGVTGTKGKGTTSSMIASIFEASGKKVWLVGNIGVAAIDMLDQIQPDDIVVYELSSFQLWDVERSPHVSVVLPIEAEHLNVHDDMADYVNAKANIARFQQDDDICIYNPDNEYSKKIGEESSAGTALQYGHQTPGSAYIEGDVFKVDEHIICSVSELQLRGPHNQENACAALTVAKKLGISNDDIAAGLRNFKGLPHRIEFVRRFKDVDFYNDSFSSSPPATIAAARSFSEPEILIIGGIDRGGDFDHLARELKTIPNIKEIVIIGEIRHHLETIFKDQEVSTKLTVLDATTMHEVVAYAAQIAETDDVVILSPGCASFDMFKDFYDRGDQFRQEVQALGEAFVFESYDFNAETGKASFHYRSPHELQFTEVIAYQASKSYDAELLDRALFLAFVLIGTSYYKTFPTSEVRFESGSLTPWQADFFSKVYQEGLSQFAFENDLTRDDLAHFEGSTGDESAVAYEGEGIIALQSGGKDSLLTAVLLKEQQTSFTPWYLANGDHHPAVLDDLGESLLIARRVLDKDGLVAATELGAKNGHVPVTYIVQSIALIQAILMGKNEVIVSIAHEGEEPHAMIGDLPVTHQWSKTWEAEQLFAEYVARYISPDLKIGSPLRRYSELKVAQLFITHAWKDFGHRFSSCNRANYQQGADNTELHWCGECPKCANSFLLFAPFLDAQELHSLFGGQDLFEKPILQETFKGLLGIDGVMKPFECVGEIDELRSAYHRAQAKGGYKTVSFEVPEASFDYLKEYPAQDWSHL